MRKKRGRKGIICMTENGELEWAIKEGETFTVGNAFTREEKTYTVEKIEGRKLTYIDENGLLDYYEI